MARKDVMLRLHARLVARRDALRKALSGDLDSLRELSSLSVGDQIDAAVDSANDEISSQLIEIESRELEQIERALERIVKGVYGRCEYCGQKISEARLNALPYTSTCIECAREVERLGLRPHSMPDSSRWAKVFDKAPNDEGESDGPVNLSDFELDMSESGR
jgi:DnaK suppressor protein